MMNQSKTSKAGIWKVATFLPLLALLLMAFGRTGENVPNKVIAPPEIIQEQQSPQTGFSVEIKKDGNYLNNKLVSVEEIVKQAKAWQKTNEEILLVVDDHIPYNRVDEVRLELENAKIYFVNQKSPNSDEIIYPAGDVTDMAKFTQGKWSDWMKNQLKNLTEGKSDGWTYKITYSFIIDKNGKVRDGHLMKGSDNPEINAAFEKCLQQIPDWKPAKKGNKEVSVFYRAVHSRYAPPPGPSDNTKKNVALTPPIFIEIKKEGVFLMKDLVSLEELKKQLPLIVKKNPQSEIWLSANDKSNSELEAVNKILKEAGVWSKVKYR